MDKKRWRIPIPDVGWLAEQYLLPPDGLGRSCPDIGIELGVGKHTVQRWVKKLGLRQALVDRQRQSQLIGARLRRKMPPSKHILAQKFLIPPDGEGKTEDQLCIEFNVSRPTVRKWLKEYNLIQPHSLRHSHRMSGKNNPAYTNGNSHRYVGRSLTKVKPKVCEWCKTKENVQIHHVDHNRENNDLGNLMWLCHSCNMLEAFIWQLEQTNRIKIEHKENVLTIEFLGELT